MSAGMEFVLELGKERAVERGKHARITQRRGLERSENPRRPLE